MFICMCAFAVPPVMLAYFFAKVFCLRSQQLATWVAESAYASLHDRSVALHGGATQEMVPPLLQEVREKGAAGWASDGVFDNRESFTKTSQWIIGGDRWAYDMGLGGLGHLVAIGCDVHILVLYTEAHRNTDGQKRKSTPSDSIAMFTMGGETRQVKNLGEIIMAYHIVYSDSDLLDQFGPDVMGTECVAEPSPHVRASRSSART